MNFQLNNVKWLLLREYWEMRKALVIVPLLLGVLSLVGLAAWFFVAIRPLNPSQEAPYALDLALVGTVAGFAAFREALFSVLLTCNFMILGYTGVLTGLYAINSLYDDRVDRSVLFWHSMPVSDTETVVSKALMALIVIPCVGVFVSFAVSMGAVAFYVMRVPGAGDLWQELAMTLGSYYTVVPLQMASAFLAVAWMMFVSAFSSGRPLIWAFTLPIGIVVLTAFLQQLGLSEQDTGFLAYVAFATALGLFPGWYMNLDELQKVDHDIGLLAANHLFTLPYFWIGAALGVGLLILTIRVRSKTVDVS